MRFYRNRFLRAAAVAAVLLSVCAGARAVRIKDLGEVYGPMENPITGKGLVVGLSGSGDDAKFAPAIKMLANMLNTLGTSTLPVEVAGTKNVAVVNVTATLPRFHKVGDRMDVKVSAVGNAKSLAGGRLVICPLGAGGEMYALASGDVKIDERYPTSAVVAGGAIIQRELPAQLTPGNKLTFKLLPQNADYSTASRIVDAIHQDLSIDLEDTSSGGTPVARAVDAATIEVSLTPEQLANPVPFISQLERLSIPGLDYDMEARVHIDEKNGTFYAINGNAEISPVTVGHNSIQITIGPDTEGGSSTLYNLVEALSDLKASPEDVVGILKSLEKVGALHAKVVRE